jgi:hypothetical protein
MANLFSSFLAWEMLESAGPASYPFERRRDGLVDSRRFLEGRRPLHDIKVRGEMRVNPTRAFCRVILYPSSNDTR